ncbi:MAG: D-glycero-beta-D-manno-heptose-7-phosphate kinase [Bacteroidales bacterium]
MDSHIIEQIQRFEGKKILIIGDVMIDSYLFGTVDRISPEAPVPVVSVQRRQNRLGGAANVALNIKAMGAEPILCSVIGSDARGDDFLKLMNEEGLAIDGIYRSGTRPTTTKFRVIGNRMQLLRVDEESAEPLNKEEYNSLMNLLSHLTDESIDAVVFQDYDKGVITPELITAVTAITGRLGIPVAVDPKKRNFKEFRGVTLFKPNLKELREGLNIEVSPLDRESLENAAARLKEVTGAEWVMITLSEHGIFIRHDGVNDSDSVILPARVRSVADVSGAGDTVISIAALGLATGMNAEEIATVANAAGGLVCEKVGVVPVDKSELLTLLSRSD